MEKELPHLRILKPTASEPFTSPKKGRGDSEYPKRKREQHGTLIKNMFEEAWKENEKTVTHFEQTGIYIEFQSSPDPNLDLAIKSLENLKKGIHLCNVREESIKQSDEEKNSNKKIQYATVYIPNNQKNIFDTKIEEYLNEKTKTGKPKNKNLIEHIEKLQKAHLESFWTDDKSLIPSSQQEWCEVWLRGESEETIIKFDKLLQSQNIYSKKEYLKFPERFVKLIYASENQLSDIIKNSDDIAEYRRAKETAEFLLSQSPAEQSKWADDLSKRTSVDEDTNISVCILDTGINNGNPLLKPLLSDKDCHTLDPNWGKDDQNSHGTLMAGLAAYGDLREKLENNNQVYLTHILESVKILSPKEKNEPELYGDITKQALSRAEIQAKDRKRIICMAISSDDARDQGQPSSWSGAIDQITSGAEEEDKRLFILAAGNFTNYEQMSDYPNPLMTYSIHDPAQSWNAITVGAFTELTNITDTGYNAYSPLAKAGEISPFSTTSLTWEDSKWPIKPEVVFEGGNIAMDKRGFPTECNDLSLISTYYKPKEKLLSSFSMTSAAAAQAAYFAAQIQAQYPDYWPETVRALMIHSAEWPQALKGQFKDKDSKINKMSKTELGKLLRICGYGVPNLEKAIYCASNSLTLVAEAEIQPFEKEKSEYKTKDMHLYELPWPKEVLESLGGLDIEMRVTLSYFIEPGPGRIGWKDRYRYASHALRFDLNSPGETKDLFRKRVNLQSRDENEGNPDTKSPSKHWMIGSSNRDKGSIHSDIWQGTAADLAASNLIAITPVIGWWRERRHLKKFDKKGRYSLIISITTNKQDIDIYTPVKVVLEAKVTTEIKL